MLGRTCLPSGTCGGQQAFRECLDEWAFFKIYAVSDTLALDLYGENPYASFQELFMSENYELPMSRIDARIPLVVRDTIDRAAAMQGRTRTDFLIAAALEKAERVIAEQNLIRLTMQDQESLAKALSEEKVSEPSPLIQALAREYGGRVTQA